ncbi:CAP domain-containing protein, partial [Clostridium perfringens]
FQRVNQERAAAGLPALSYNGTMESYARIKSKDMGDRGYFDHKDPEGRLITEKMKADGVSYRAWGENIAYIQGVNGNSTLATQFMDNWMNSPGHRANILSSNFSSIGVGVYKIGNTYYATQEFYK